MSSANMQILFIPQYFKTGIAATRDDRSNFKKSYTIFVFEFRIADAYYLGIGISDHDKYLKTILMRCMGPWKGDMKDAENSCVYYHRLSGMYDMDELMHRAITYA